jgi:hypothetical protein
VVVVGPGWVVAVGAAVVGGVPGFVVVVVGAAVTGGEVVVGAAVVDGEVGPVMKVAWVVEVVVDVVVVVVVVCFAAEGLAGLDEHPDRRVTAATGSPTHIANRLWYPTPSPPYSPGT